MTPIVFSIIMEKFLPEKLAIDQGIFNSSLSGGGVIRLIIGRVIVELWDGELSRSRKRPITRSR
jgi:hypothetical protein